MTKTAGSGETPPRRVFVDTNILIYAGRTAEPFSRAACDALDAAEAAGDELCISREVLREYLAAVTRPQVTVGPMPVTEAVADVTRLEEIFTVFEDGPAVTEGLYALLLQVPTGGRQVHDANIVATMLAYGVTRLLTFNGSDFRRFSSMMQIVAP
jgi:predicted nucleic acid-binding protein